MQVETEMKGFKNEIKLGKHHLKQVTKAPWLQFFEPLRWLMWVRRDPSTLSEGDWRGPTTF